MRVKFTTKFIKNTIKKSSWTPIILAGTSAAIFCLYLYGGGIINPTNTSWLYANGDISQHQIGWDFFRNDEWRLPLGSIGNLAYPAGTSLVYMDSIPLAAITLKVFEPLLPEHFQYFGLWGLLSFALMGCFAALIFRKYTSNIFLIIAGALLVTASPVFLMRTYAHTALASQWILLAGMSLILYRHKLASYRASVAAWSVLFAVAVAVHPYFVPMSAILLAAYLALRRMSLARMASHVLSAGASFIATFWLIGGFVTKDVGTATLGMFGADINALINPINFSYFIKPFPTTAYAYEGLAYAGLGVYILLLVALSMRLMRVTSVKSVYSSSLKWMKENRRVVIVLVILLMSIVLAVGPVWYLNGRLLMTLDIPDVIARGLSIFRSTGRFMWIASYVLSIFAVISIFKQVGSRHSARVGVILFFTLILTIQFLDVTRSDGMRAKVATIRQKTESRNRFDTEDVKSVLDDKKHVAYVENTLHANDFFELGPVVALQGATINDGYISRKPVASVNKETASAREALVTNRLDTHTAYVTNNEADLAAVAIDPSISIIRINDTWIITRK